MQNRCFPYPAIPDGQPILKNKIIIKIYKEKCFKLAKKNDYWMGIHVQDSRTDCHRNRKRLKKRLVTKNRWKNNRMSMLGRQALIFVTALQIHQSVVLWYMHVTYIRW